MTKRCKIRLEFIGFVVIAIGITLYTVLYRINKTYDPYEVAQINAFLAQKSGKEQKMNGEVLGYGTEWPLFWGFMASKSEKERIRKFSEISCFDKKGYNRQLKGTFSIDGFEYLERITINRNMVNSVLIKNCPQLSKLFGTENDIKFVLIENCPSLEEMWLSHNPLERLDVTGCPNLKELELEYCPLKELVVMETHPWQKWGIASTTKVTIHKKIVE